LKKTATKKGLKIESWNNWL